MDVQSAYLCSLFKSLLSVEDGVEPPFAAPPPGLSQDLVNEYTHIASVLNVAYRSPGEFEVGLSTSHCLLRFTVTLPWSIEEYCKHMPP